MVVVRRLCPRQAHAWLLGAALTLCYGTASGDTDSSSLRGYTGSGVLNGYTGSGVLNGYNGTGIVGFSRRPGAGQDIPRCYSFGDGFATAVMGPVESIVVTGDSMTIRVIGQMFDLPADDSLAIGDYVVAAAAEGQAEGVVYLVGATYVPGVSTVRIKASASSVDLGVGQAMLGATHVDFTGLLSSTPSLAPRANDVLVFAGIQPAPGGVIIAGPDPNGAVGCSASDGRM